MNEDTNFQDTKILAKPLNPLLNRIHLPGMLARQRLSNIERLEFILGPKSYMFSKPAYPESRTPELLEQIQNAFPSIPPGLINVVCGTCTAQCDVQPLTDCRSRHPGSGSSG